MPSRNLIPSIALPDDYFAGSLQTDYITQWNPTRLSKAVQTTGIKEYRAEWYRPGAVAHVSLNAFFGDDGPEYADILRLACHHAIEHLPDEGLEELSETLDEMLGFYANRSVVKHYANLKLTTTEPVTTGASFVRDHFQIAD